MSTQSSGGPLTPCVGEPLPAANEATIDPDKLKLYALDLDSDRGYHKAVVFQRALGIELNDWEYLRDSVLEALPSCPVYIAREPQREEERTTWGVLVPVHGRGEQSERRLLVTTAWTMTDGRPVLVTIRVANKTMQA